MLTQYPFKLDLKAGFFSVILVAVVLVSWRSPVLAEPSCPPPRQTWFVEAGAPDGGNGSKKSPLNSGQQISECTATGNNIFIKPSAQALEGQIELKPNQKLTGLGRNIINANQNSTLMPRLGLRSGAGIVLADHVTVKNLVIEEIDAPTAPARTSVINGQLSEGGVSLKQIRITKSEEFSGAGAISLDLDAANQLDAISLDKIRIETEANFAGANVANWFRVGIRFSLGGQSGNCADQTLQFNMSDIEVTNSSGSVGIFQFCPSGTQLSLDAHDVRVTNGIGDHFLVINQGLVDAEIGHYRSTIEPLVRDVILQSSFSPALDAGANFGLEYFGFPTAGASRLKVRDSKITGNTGVGVGILQFPKANPTEPTNLILDFGCTDNDCTSRGLETSAGNNAIFDNVSGTGDPLGNDYENYMLSPFGLALIFPLPVMVDPAISANIGASQNLFMDTPEDVQLIGQGNFWGYNTAPEGLGTCAEIGISFGPFGASLSQTNPADFSASNQWTCSLWNTFTLSGFPTQPDTSDALGYDPNN